jgi:hypothetical protein
MWPKDVIVRHGQVEFHRGDLFPHHDPLVTWALRRLELLTEGGRASGTAEVTVRRQANAIYPWCSEHGAMNRVGGRTAEAAATGPVWRCLVEGCNVGCRYPVPFDSSVLL